MVLMLQAACLTHTPVGGQLAGSRHSRTTMVQQEFRPAPPQFEPVLAVQVEMVEPRGSTRVVVVTRAEFQRAVQ
ncbi:hypothetical protein BO221_45015 [Archangium sp. Cb G35]|nr:hypothetical protein BO221_45015 [Archangium sp. Cb G35]